MPSCVALGCHRRGEPILKVFPRKDPRRRQIWVERVNRPGWYPTQYSALCERHFDKEQWELPREDGKRKLKDTALPTVFVVPPSPGGDGIFLDHAYCLPHYRKIYEDGEYKRQALLCDRVERIYYPGATPVPQYTPETMPIEHVKVEVDGSESFAPETGEEEETGEQRGEGRGTEEEDIEEPQSVDVEDIQCTPDISVFPEDGEPFPEDGEPFPIEMVDCEADDVNEFMTEPDHDPLAISVDDQVKAATQQPYFGKSQKFLFVPKTTKVVVNIPSKAKGEPEVNSSESKNPLGAQVPLKAKETNTSESLDKPRLKVKSLDGLLDPKVVKKTSLCSLDLDSKVILRSPSAVYVKEPLTLTSDTVASPVKVVGDTVTSPVKVDSSPARKRLDIDQKVVTLTSSTFNFPPKVKNNLIITASPTAAPPKLKLVSQQLTVTKDPNFVRKMPNLKIEKPVVLPPRPNVPIDKPNSIRLQGSKERFIRDLQKMRFERRKQILIEKNVKIAPKPSDGKDPPPLTKCVTLKMPQGLNKQVRVPFNTPYQNKKSGSVEDTRPVTNNSIIVLKPFGTNKSHIVDTSEASPESISALQKFISGNQSITIYQCFQCQTSFMTHLELQNHKKKTGHVRKGSEGNRKESRGNPASKVEVVTVETSGSSNDSTDSESDDDSSETDLSEDDSETETAAGVSNPVDDSSSESWGCAATEGNNVSGVPKKTIIKKNVISKHPQKLDNSWMKISNLGSMRHLRMNEFSRLFDQNRIERANQTKKFLEHMDRESNKTLDGRRQSESSSVDSEPKLDKGRVRNITEDDIRIQKVKPTGKNSVNIVRKVSKKPMFSATKTDCAKKNRSLGESFKGYDEEKELIVLSSSSSSSCSSSSSQSSDYDSDDSREDEISSKNEVSNAQSKQTSCEVDARRLGELIKKKKEVKEDLQDYHLEPQKVKDNIRKSTVLSPKVNLKKISNDLSRGNGCRLDVAESIDEVVISDDDAGDVWKGWADRDESSEKSVAVNVTSVIDKEKEPVEANDSECEILMELDRLVEKEIKEEAKSLKPIILLPKLDLDIIKNNATIKTGCESSRHENGDKINEVSSLNKRINSVRRIQMNENDSKELCSLKKKIKENSSFPPLDSLQEGETVESKTRARHIGKRSCYEKYKANKKISKQNPKRIVRNSVENLMEDFKERKRKESRERREELEFNQCTKYDSPTSVKRLKPNKEQDKSKNKYEKTPSQMEMCKLCGKKVKKSKFKLHVFQHMQMTSVCKVCNQKFTHSVLLRRHMKSEHFV